MERKCKSTLTQRKCRPSIRRKRKPTLMQRKGNKIGNDSTKYEEKKCKLFLLFAR